MSMQLSVGVDANKRSSGNKFDLKNAYFRVAPPNNQTEQDKVSSSITDIYEKLTRDDQL